MQENQTSEAVQAEVLPMAKSMDLLRVEIDIAISTAKAYPRSMTKFLQKSESQATLSVGIAESCNFGLPVKERNEKTGQMETKIIEGPSIRLAEIMLSNFGNARAAARVVSNDGKKITAQGIFHDLETNIAITLEVERSIVNKYGRTYSERMQVITGNAACSIAFRNAAFKGIGMAYVYDIWEKTKELVKGDIKTLPERRKKALDYFRSKKVKDEQICLLFNIKHVDDMDLEMLSRLSAMKTSLQTEEATIDELFPVVEDEKAKKAADKASKAAEDKLKKKDTPPAAGTIFDGDGGQPK